MATYRYVNGQYVPTDDPFFVTTDGADYAATTTAVLTAGNFVPGATIEFSVAHVDPGPDGIVGTADDGLTHDLMGTTQPWTVTDGGIGDLDGLVNGSITTTWYVNPDAVDQAFQLSATDNAAGLMATS